ncbi:aldehyde dehydrogenase family protein [Advenella kashmirensis]|uniref:aldehyde dehydrogenase family protein n=1 Tax=Advenella kashmirensis TaxID=310575 RepID=UPI0004183D6A|nr:aldehyde dehydrogenase family protein [Advenella kashmirensis]
MNKLLERFGIAKQHIFIKNEWIYASGNTIAVSNPVNGKEIGQINETSVSQTDSAVSAALTAFPAWSATPAPERARYLYAFADLIDANLEDLALLLTQEQGKPLLEARAEVSFSSAFLRHAAEAARRLEGEILPGDARDEHIMIHRVPYGVVAGITAWNFPVALFTRKVGPALVTGNTIVIKPHELTPLTALVLAELARKAGLPAGVLNVVTGAGRTVGEHLVKHPDVSLISMTGSVRAGREIYAAASHDIKTIRLELGGKAPFIVLADADLDKAVQAAIQAKFVNGGQVCTANDRMYIEEAIYDKFVAKFTEAVRNLRTGDPLEQVDLGPRASQPEVSKLHAILERACRSGAKVLLNLNDSSGPDPAHTNGNWFYPAVLEVTSNDLEIMQEETFGPIAPIMKVSSLTEAITYANQSKYGLSAYVFTQNNRNIMRCVAELQFGEIFINRGAGESVHAFHAGYKLSGIGGEDGKHGIEGYLRKKTLYNNFS